MHVCNTKVHIVCCVQCLNAGCMDFYLLLTSFLLYGTSIGIQKVQQGIDTCELFSINAYC